VDAEWWQRNFNSGGRLGHETAADARVATVGIHFGASGGSTIELPIEPAVATGANTEPDAPAN
jgi:hypothetical protein